MKNGVIAVRVKEVLLKKNQGCAVFIGNDEKTFIIYVDPNMGAFITMYLQGIPKERPLTHDLIGHIFQALDVKLERVVINALKNSTYYARLILKVDNEIHRKVMEIDARPSDCIALALQAQAPMYVSREVWDAVEDMTELLESITASAQEEGDEDEEEEEGDEEEDEGGKAF
ncbi:MAG: bifunctional nuclease family protein [Verrucomicrobiae bacterium]|nr:bifunctional nuclease family protein [Verrucomicrobiae bacterium]